MKNILAVIEVDLEASRIGLRSRIEEGIAGVPVLQRTVERVRMARSTGRVVLSTGPSHADRLRKRFSHLLGPSVELHVSDEPDIPGRDRLRRGRRWSLPAWRGGLGDAHFLSESGNPRRLLDAARRHGADAVLLVPAEAALVDPCLLDNLVEEARAIDTSRRALLSTAPPGLAGDLLSVTLLEALAHIGRSIEAVLDFRPDSPGRNVDAMGMCHWFDESISGARCRLLADSSSGTARLRGLVELLDGRASEAGATEIISLLEGDPDLASGAFPRQVTLDITGRRNHPCPLDPPTPGDIDIDIDPASVACLLKEASSSGVDDLLVTVGGLGEPLLHPRLREVLRILREARPFGLALETDGLLLEGDLLEEILSVGPDVIVVHLDATHPETYRLVFGGDGLERAEAGLDRVIDAASSDPGAPFIVPLLRELQENTGEVEAFFDRWYPRTRWVTIGHHNDFAGQVPFRGRTRHVPPKRHPCVKIREGLWVRPDGRVPLCPQALEGPFLGQVGETAIRDMWQAPALRELRASQASGGSGAHPLCRTCSDWCRP